MLGKEGLCVTRSDITMPGLFLIGIIFVAIMKQHVLKDHLYRFQWVGVVYNVVSVFMVGSTAILSEGEKDNADEDDSGSASTALLGVLLVMLGALVQAMVRNVDGRVASRLIPPSVSSSYCAFFRHSNLFSRRKC